MPKPRTGSPVSRPRRWVLSGVAWAVPVIAVGAAASSAAASGEPPVVVTLGTACGHNPSSGTAHMHVELILTNTSATPVVVTITDVSLLPVNGDPVTFPQPSPVVVGAGGSSCVVLDSDAPGDGSGSTVVVQYAWTTTNASGASSATLAGGAFPACQSQGVPDYPHPGYTCSTSPA